MNVYRIEYTANSRYDSTSREPKFVAAANFEAAARVAEAKVQGTITSITLQTSGLIVGD